MLLEWHTRASMEIRTCQPLLTSSTTRNNEGEGLLGCNFLFPVWKQEVLSWLSRILKNIVLPLRFWHSYSVTTSLSILKIGCGFHEEFPSFSPLLHWVREGRQQASLWGPLPLLGKKKSPVEESRNPPPLGTFTKACKVLLQEFGGGSTVPSAF